MLAAALTALPVAASAQTLPTPQAMVELNATDINTWGFAAVVPVGGTIAWTNMGAQSHTVTTTDGSFDSGLVSPGAYGAASSSTVEGTYAYVCTPHPWMTGYVVVTPDAHGELADGHGRGQRLRHQYWGFAVSVSAGQTVAWTNMGGQAHTATAADGSFDTGLVTPGSSAPVQFDTPGLYAYMCTPHPWMKGNVAVN